MTKIAHRQGRDATKIFVTSRWSPDTKAKSLCEAHPVTFSLAGPSQLQLRQPQALWNHFVRSLIVVYDSIQFWSTTIQR